MQAAIEHPDEILWDIVGEHLDEAAFAFETWTGALESPLYTLDELARGPEEQLLAHVDALVVGGSPVSQRLLEPELAAPPEPSLERLVAASLGLLGQGHHEPVVQALASSEPLVQQAARRALELGGAPELDVWLVEQLSSPLPPAHRRALLPLAAARGVALPNVLEPLQSDDVAEVAAAALAARYSDPGRHSRAVEYLTAHADSRVRDAALVTALSFGSSVAFQRCLTLAADETTPEPLAMLLVALLGGPIHHQLLVDHLARPTHRCAALRALGYSGQAALVQALIEQLASEDPLAPRLAAEALSTITGLDTTADEYVALPPPEPESLPPLEEDDLDADLVPPVEEELPPPNAQALVAFWSAHAAAFDERQRLLEGRPWSAARALDLLSRASMRRRHPVALWLLIRTGGAARVDTRALTRVQLEQLAAAGTLSDQALVLRFGGA